MNGLTANNILFQKLAKTPPKWWRSINDDKDLSIQIRKDNTIDIYYNCGAVITGLKYGRKGFSGSISAKYIPLEKKYYPYSFIENEVEFPRDKIKSVKLNNFSQETLNAIKGQISQYFPKTSEKGIQADFMKNDPYFIDMEYEYGNDLRIDLVRLDFSIKKIVFVEVKLVGNKELYTNNIVEQLSKYRRYIKDNKAMLIKYYNEVFNIKKNLGILPRELACKEIRDFDVLDKPLLLLGDCEQAWIDEVSSVLDEKIKATAIGCYYFGNPKCSCEIIAKTKGNRHICS
jgi:hypothetical protein